MSISLQVKGAVEAAREYRAKAQRANDVRPAMERIKDFWLLSEQRQFDSGKGWPDIKPVSREWKMKRGLDPRVMRATGALERVLTQPNQQGRGQIANTFATGMTVGIGPAFGKYPFILAHKWPLVGFDSKAQADATELMGRWIQEGATR